MKIHHILFSFSKQLNMNFIVLINVKMPTIMNRINTISFGGHYSCENCLEEVQGATASSHIPPPLLQDPWPCVQLLRAERHAPCQ